MLCPFCAEEVKDEAIVCKHCTRDISVPKPILQKNEELEKKVWELQTELDGLKGRLGYHETESAIRDSKLHSGASGWMLFVAGMVIVPIALLLLAHYLMTVRFDVNVLYLRIVSMLVPLPFGFALFWKYRSAFHVPVIVGAVVGICAVFGMLTVIGLVDHVPIVPRDQREWQEALEYALSIGLAVITGYMLARIAHRFFRSGSKSSGIVNTIAREIASMMGPTGNEQSLKDRIASIEQLLNSGVTVATTLGSIYAGVKGVLN